MFWTRLISGIAMLTVAILAMFVGDWPLLLILYLCSMVAFRELTKVLGCATEKKNFNALEIIGFFGITGYYGAVYFSVDKVMLLMCIVTLFMAEMFWYVITFPKYKADQVVAAFFSFMYAPLMLSFVYLTRMSSEGFYLVWLILISSWGCDTCAYAVGKLIGRKKIFPKLSPKKSLEGCFGGVLGAAIIGGIYGYIIVEKVLPGQNIAWVIAFICAVAAVMSMVGDLAASAIKRNRDIKDYGTLIPGHGGIMDRFDSMTVTAPMIYFLSLLMIM